MALRQEALTGLCDDVDLGRDRALVERCQAGDTAAFGNLYARYYERLLRFCLRRLNDRHEAEDAAQEAFARAWKALPRFAVNAGSTRGSPSSPETSAPTCCGAGLAAPRPTTWSSPRNSPSASSPRTPPRTSSSPRWTASSSTARSSACPPVTATSSRCARGLGGRISRSPTTRESRSGPSRRCSGEPARRSSASSPQCPNQRERWPASSRRAPSSVAASSASLTAARTSILGTATAADCATR